MASGELGGEEGGGVRGEGERGVSRYIKQSHTVTHTHTHLVVFGEVAMAYLEHHDMSPAADVHNGLEDVLSCSFFTIVGRVHERLHQPCTTHTHMIDTHTHTHS